MRDRLRLPADLVDRLRSKGINPTDLVLYVTSRCNLRCRHCYVGNELLGAENSYDLDSLQSFLASIERVDRITVLGGEPFLYREIVTLIQTLDNPKIAERRLTTNLTFAHRRALAALETAKFRVCVSVDGHTPSLHDGIRGDGTFERTIANLRDLVARSFDIEVTHTITAQTAPHIDNFIDLMQSLGIRRINLHKISPRGNAIDALDLAVGPTAWRKLVSSLEARSLRRGQSANTRIRYELLHCTSSEYDQLVLSGEYAPHAASSFYSQTGGQRIVLYPDGRIYISSEAFGTESHVGSIKNGEFEFNELSTNEISLFNSTRNAFRVHMINNRLEGDERFPIVLSVSYRREAHV